MGLLLLLVLLRLLMVAMSLGWGSRATDTPMYRYRDRAKRRVFGKDAPKQELGKLELCGGVCGRSAVWRSKIGSVLRPSGAGLDCLRGGAQCQASGVRRDNKFERQLWCGSCRRCKC